MFSAISTGSTNDILAWDMCAMKSRLENGDLPFPYYFIGDEAFCCVTQFLVPLSGHSLDEWRDAFNYHLSAMRQCIERAFGVLTGRWGIFWRPVRCAFKNWTLVATVAAKLHNFLIDMNETDVPERYYRDHTDGDAHHVFMNGNNDDSDDDSGIR